MSLSADKLEYSKKEYAYLERGLFNLQLSSMGNMKNKYVVDIGSGPGHFATALSKQKPSLICCLDINKDWLLFSRNELKKKNIKNVTFVRGEASNLPLKGESFDLVVSIVTIPYLRDDGIAISEMSRILKRKGRIYLKLHGIGYHLHRFFVTRNPSWFFREFLDSFVSLFTGKKMFNEPHTFQFPYKIKSIFRRNKLKIDTLATSNRFGPLYQFFSILGEKCE